MVHKTQFKPGDHVIVNTKAYTFNGQKAHVVSFHEYTDKEGRPAIDVLRGYYEIELDTPTPLDPLVGGKWAVLEDELLPASWSCYDD